jgi:integrase
MTKTGRSRRRDATSAACRSPRCSASGYGNTCCAPGAAATSCCSASESGSPFSPSRVTARADKAWQSANDKTLERAGREGREVEPGALLERLTLHEARHCYASYMIAAGVNAKALSTYMGHATIAITLDLYGHMLAGNEEEAAGLLDAYLTRSQTA